MEKNLSPKSCDTVPFLLSIVFAVYRLPLRWLSVGYGPYGGMVGYPSRVASCVFVHIRDKCSPYEAIQSLQILYNTTEMSLNTVHCA
jgi:hypothetical protein